ncbi:DUF2637 domain-containing protein [Tsukamurella tyrosinosolvens]|uniref:DUF2637 domain-containing protein n=1 Tax=Tsukamurella tyrosinosolvens TaxID=57704 RepID=UPI000C7EA91F|nr:DUF2637 domain-containing protein [Tsukamurella tyrosinosolvens]AUN38628.1 hypothetical protein ASU32_00230 [Tsukamurella tyrosinosolvens]
MTTTEKSSDTLREVRRILWTLLIAATIASVAGNVAHTVIVHGWRLATIGPVVLALLGPVALLGLFHLMAAWARAAAEAASAIFWFYLLAIIGLAAAAFRLSFAALRDLALHYGYGRFDAALFPLILDGVIAVCTVGLVAATRPRRKVKPTARPSIPQRVRGWWRGTPDDAKQPAEPIDAPIQERVIQPAPLPEPRTMDCPAEPMDQVTDQPVDQTPAAVDQPEPQVIHTPVDQTLDHHVNRDNTVTEPLPVQTADRDPEPVSHHSTAEVDRDLEPVNRRPLALVDQPANRDVDHRAIAEQVVARTASDWSVDQLERVSQSTPGLGQRALADELGVSPTTVNRMRKAIAEVAADSDNAEGAEPEPALA